MEEKTDYSSLGAGFEENQRKKRVGIPMWVIAFLLASLGLAAVSMVRFPRVLREYKCYQEAEGRMGQGETAAALYDLLGLVEAHPRSVPVITRLIDLSMEAGYYDLAAYTFDTYLVGKELSDSQYARMLGHQNRLEAYYASYEMVSGLMETLMADAGSEEEAALAGRQMVEELTGYLNDPSYDQAVLHYFLGLFSTETKERYGYLRQCYEEDPELFDTRVQLANIARRMGNLEEAGGYLEEAFRKDKEDAGTLRAMAILSMLEEDKEEALELAYKAYELDPEGTYVRDTYLVALHVNGREEEKAEILEEMGGILEEDTEQLLSGACSLWEYYTE